MHTLKGAQSSTDQRTPRNSQHLASMFWPHSRWAGGRQCGILNASQRAALILHWPIHAVDRCRLSNWMRCGHRRRGRG
eukprot:2536341-Karenia_brevis.AAC.1